MHDAAASDPAAGRTAGDLAIVLHSHMPYVEGFGTYPFGEEWLFDAVIRSYLPVLAVARDVTMTVTPVLADQLEDPGVRERLRRFLVEWRIGAAEADAAEVPPECRPACEAELERYRRALELLDAAGGDPLRPFAEAEAEGRVALMASSATHAVLPMLATAEGLRLQVDAGIRSHRRRFGWDGGFWLPECAYEPGLEWGLAEHGVRWFCVDQSAQAGGARRADPDRHRGRPGGAADRLGGGQLALVAGRLPLRPRSRPVRRQVAARDPDLEGRRRRLRPGRGRRGGAAPGRRVPRRRRRAAARLRPPSGAAAACSSSRSTPSCSATGGRRGRSGSRR